MTRELEVGVRAAVPVPRRRLLRHGTGLLTRLTLVLAASGCPQVLSDDFRIIAAERGDTGSAAGATALGSGDAGGVDRGDGDAGTGGTSSTCPGCATCSDGVQNQSETGVDCGGPCGACASCSDGAQNQNETGIDCGGVCAACECSWTAFDAPQRLTGLGLSAGVAAWGPALSTDALTLIFSSGTPEKLFQAQRTARNATFSAASALPAPLDGPGDRGTAFLGFDGLALYFYTKTPKGDRDIHVARRPDEASPFDKPGPVGGVNGSANDHLPWVSSDELRMYFSSTRSGGAGGYDLWVASRSTPSSPFGAPRALSELNTADDDEGASLTSDELTLFFSTSRASAFDDIWMTSRPTRDADFEPPVPVVEVNSSASELNVTLSADGRELFFTTDRAGGNFELWRALRRCE